MRLIIIFLFFTYTYSQDYSLEFDGVDDSINIGNFPLADFTFNAWININTVNTANLNAIISRIVSVYPRLGFELSVEDNSTIKLLTGTGISWSHHYSPEPVNTNEWISLSATAEGNQFNIYINSILVLAATSSHANSNSDCK